MNQFVIVDSCKSFAVLGRGWSCVIIFHAFWDKQILIQNYNIFIELNSPKMFVVK